MGLNQQITRLQPRPSGKPKPSSRIGCHAYH
jgi:hypothetical protein